jgi:hypothetical protein
MTLAILLQEDTPALPIDAVGWTVLGLGVLIVVAWLVYLWR